jgi:nucleoid DNA-binding protein
LKLAPLLAEYLYAKKRLDLTGIGTFVLNPATGSIADAKHSSEEVSFEENGSVKEDEELINYISSHTGKMKALASSDLNSYLDLAKEFLNIGNPFQIEGIGTLMKKKSGQYEFTAEHLLSDKVKESGMKELSVTSTSDESFTTFENLKPKVEKSSPYKKIFLILLIAATTFAIIWGGYRVYKKNSGKNKNEELKTEKIIPKKDTTVIQKPIQKNELPANNYRFVIEVAGKNRALYRFNQLKSYGTPIQLSTKDSVEFKLFFVLPALAADTTKISDSLSILYPSINGRKTFIEK